MFDFTPFTIAVYASVLVVLFFVELIMFWAGCAIADQEPPSWAASFVVVLPVFAVTVVLFEVICRYFGVGPSIDKSPLHDYGLGTVPFAALVGTLASWIVALVLYIPAVTSGSLYKGFWVASTEVVFRSVIVLLLGGLFLVGGAGWQVGFTKPKEEPAANQPAAGQPN